MVLWIFGHFELVKQYISKTIWARGLKLGAADRGLWVDNLNKFIKKKITYFLELRSFDKLGILNWSARYLENYLS